MNRSNANPDAEQTPWHHPACLDDEALLSQCSANKTRASGPGGQHRNKVETGVELSHTPTGVEAHATERRSVTENKRVALKRLRLALAVKVRTPVPMGEIGSDLWRSRVRGAVRHPGPKADPVLRALGVKLRDPAQAAAAAGAAVGRIVVSPDHRDYPAMLAEALDVIAACGWDVKAAGARLGVSMSQLLKLVRDHSPALTMMNARRVEAGMKGLK
jgi:hypothetical protein